MAAMKIKFDPDIDADKIQTIQSSKIFKTKEEELAVLELMREAEILQRSKNLAKNASASAMQEFTSQYRSGSS